MAKTSTSFTKDDPRINRNGRPPKPWTMEGLIREAAEEENESGIPKKKLIANKLTELAAAGDITAIKEVNNRLDGMPVQKNILAGDEENPIQLDVTSMIAKVYGNDSTGEVHTDS